jgi:hypothetical protein
MATGISALAILLFVVESQSLSEGHARARTQLFNASRWGFVIALSWVLIPATLSQPGPERAATILGLTVLIGALILIPVRWFIRIGGRSENWELRRAKLEVSRLANRVKHDKASVNAARLQEAVDRVRRLRTPATAQLCDLMVAELEDLMAGTESWNEGGRRSIRVDQLARDLWAEEMPPPDNDPDEATFRWFMYRAFGRMMEIGAAEPSPEERDDFRRLMNSLELCRRPDTNAFIGAVLKSAEEWLDNPAGGKPWIASYEFDALGPGGLEEVRWIWGREAAMWGAFLDDDDLREIDRDLAGRERLRAGRAAPDTAAPDMAAPDGAAATRAAVSAPSESTGATDGTDSGALPGAPAPGANMSTGRNPESRSTAGLVASRALKASQKPRTPRPPKSALTPRAAGTSGAPDALQTADGPEATESVPRID